MLLFNIIDQVNFNIYSPTYNFTHTVMGQNGTTSLYIMWLIQIFFNTFSVFWVKFSDFFSLIKISWLKNVLPFLQSCWEPCWYNCYTSVHWGHWVLTLGFEPDRDWSLTSVYRSGNDYHSVTGTRDISTKDETTKQWCYLGNSKYTVNPISLRNQQDYLTFNNINGWSILIWLETNGKNYLLEIWNGE